MTCREKMAGQFSKWANNWPDCSWCFKRLCHVQKLNDFTSSFIFLLWKITYFSPSWEHTILFRGKITTWKVYYLIFSHQLAEWDQNSRGRQVLSTKGAVCGHSLQLYGKCIFFLRDIMSSTAETEKMQLCISSHSLFW